jgi:hypothetical protein
MPFHWFWEGLMRTKLSIASLAILVMSGKFAPGHAEGIEITNCVVSYRTSSCITISRPTSNPYIRTVSAPLTAQEETELGERDRKWVARCRPVIKQDRFGVGRYHYAAAGCEFGVIGAD